MKDKFNQENANLKIKKLGLGIKVVRKKFMSQIKLLKYSPTEKISHILLRNTLIFHNVIFKVKKTSDHLHECANKIRSKETSKEEKDRLKIEMNEQQIVVYALVKNLINLLNTYSIFDHDFEIESLSNKNENDILEKVPAQYHDLVRKVLLDVKPVMPDDLKSKEKVVEGFGDPFSAAIDTIIDGIKSVIGEIEKGINIVKDFVLDIIDKIGDIFTKIFDFMEDVFKNLKDIVEFIGGFLFQCIDLFFKILKFIWLLITEWIPWFVVECWKYLNVWYNNIDVLPMAYLMQFPLDDYLGQIAEYAVPYSGNVVSYMMLGECIAFYIFWIYPKSMRIIQTYIINFVKNIIIFIISFGKEGLADGQDIAKAMQEVFLPRWFVMMFREVGPKMNENISSFTADSVSIENKAANFAKFMMDNMFAIPLKIIMIICIFIFTYRMLSPHMSYALPTIKEVTQFPLVITSDVKNFLFPAKVA